MQLERCDHGFFSSLEWLTRLARDATLHYISRLVGQQDHPFIRCGGVPILPVHCSGSECSGKRKQNQVQRGANAAKCCEDINEIFTHGVATMAYVAISALAMQCDGCSIPWAAHMLTAMRKVQWPPG